MNYRPKLTRFINDVLNISGTYYVDNEFYFRINDIPYEITAKVQQVVKILDDTEADLITLFVLEIPSIVNDDHYLGYVLEDAPYSKARKGNILGFKQDNIYRFGLTIAEKDILLDFTDKISLTYLLYLQNIRKLF
jgi:hypothetical protein